MTGTLRPTCVICRRAHNDANRSACRVCLPESTDAGDLRRRAELAEWKLKKLHQHLAWDGGATCDIPTMLGIIDGTAHEVGGECGHCKAACHPDNNVCEACLMRDEVCRVLEDLDGLARVWGDEGVFRSCRDRLRKLVESNPPTEPRATAATSKSNCSTAARTTGRGPCCTSFLRCSSRSS